jgi:uncharacterized protein
MISKKLIQRILDQYALHPAGAHGVSHWARVTTNGRRLVQSTGASLAVVELFAVFHDACRVNDQIDTDHGLRGAELAKSFRGSHFDLSDSDFEDLYSACVFHTAGSTKGNKTVQTCWDADRLDLPRVGIYPVKKRLCTEAAREHQMIAWSTRRAKTRYVPSLIRSEWGLARL